MDMKTGQDLLIAITLLKEMTAGEVEEGQGEVVEEEEAEEMGMVMVMVMFLRMMVTVLVKGVQGGKIQDGTSQGMVEGT